MNRVAAPTPPMKCFGLEQHKDNALCATCQYRRECAELMGELVELVPVDEAIFALTPVNLLCYRDTDVYSSDPDAPHLEQVYAFCYEWVFGHKAPSKVGRRRALVLERIRQSDTSLKMFLLANMLGWAQSHPDEKFHANILTGEAAVKQVKTFAAACHHQFGTFNTAALDRLMGTNVAALDLEALLLSSEITAGSWIVNHKVLDSGPSDENLYRNKELDLNAYWLAIEPSYAPIIMEHINCPEPELSIVLRKHRWNVTHALGRLKRNPKTAVALFNLRERIMPEAVRRVLRLRGFQPADFKIKQETTITAPLLFWSKLGLAIRQLECLNFVDNLDSAFNRAGASKNR